MSTATSSKTDRYAAAKQILSRIAHPGAIIGASHDGVDGGCFPRSSAPVYAYGSLAVRRSSRGIPDLLGSGVAGARRVARGAPCPRDARVPRGPVRADLRGPRLAARTGRVRERGRA